MRSDQLGFAFVWIGLACVIGLVARSLGRSARMWVGLSVLISPLFGGIILAAAELARPARRPEPKFPRGKAGGQSLAEFALVFPILFLILAGIVQFGVLFWTQNSLNQVVRDTGRFAATETACNTPAALSDIRAKANQIGASAAIMGKTGPWADSAIDVTWPTTDQAGVMYDGDADGILDPCPTANNKQHRYVTITIRHQAPIFFPWLPGNGALSATTEYRVEPPPP